MLIFKVDVKWYGRLLTKVEKYLQTSVSGWRGIQILLHTIGTMQEN